MENLNLLQTEFFLRDMYLQSVYKQEVDTNLKESTDYTQFDDSTKESLSVQTFQVLEEPVIVPNSFYTGCARAFSSRLSKLEELGFYDVYHDEGHTLLFHPEKGGLCSLDRTTCTIDAVFYDSFTFAVQRANGVSAIKQIVAGKAKDVTYNENFSYVDLPLISKLDEECLPKVETPEHLIGDISREQVEQFERTGYVFDLDCRFLQPFIANSVLERAEKRESLMEQKMASLPEDVRDYFHYSISKDAVKVKE